MITCTMHAALCAFSRRALEVSRLTSAVQYARRQSQNSLFAFCARPTIVILLPLFFYSSLFDKNENKTKQNDLTNTTVGTSEYDTVQV